MTHHYRICRCSGIIAVDGPGFGPTRSEDGGQVSDPEFQLRVSFDPDDDTDFEDLTEQQVLDLDDESYARLIWANGGAAARVNRPSPPFQNSGQPLPQDPYKSLKDGYGPVGGQQFPEACAMEMAAEIGPQGEPIQRPKIPESMVS
jgi:hypothetical protein